VFQLLDSGICYNYFHRLDREGLGMAGSAFANIFGTAKKKKDQLEGMLGQLPSQQAKKKKTTQKVVNNPVNKRAEKLAEQNKAAADKSAFGKHNPNTKETVEEYKARKKREAGN